MAKFRLRSNPKTVVEAMLFTGEGKNRNETREFVGRPIVIRQGKFFNGADYTLAGEWLIRTVGGEVAHVDAETFNDHYVAV